MALANGVLFIWTDTYIGEEGEYEQFRRRFQTTLQPVNVMPPDAINSLICALNEHVAPFIFVDNRDRAIELIEEHNGKKIILISSGTLGQELIPVVTAQYPQVHSFYFFCAIIENYVDLLYDYSNCLQIFNNETDLLVRITRDISRDMIKQGEDYLVLNHPKDALKCFEHAKDLNETVNRIDTFNTPFLEHIRLLTGYGGNVGLIQKAREMRDSQHQQTQSQPEPQHRSSPLQSQTTPANDENDDTPISQQESGDYASGCT